MHARVLTLHLLVEPHSQALVRGRRKESLVHTVTVREKSACLAEVSVTEQILREFPNSQKSWEN